MRVVEHQSDACIGEIDLGNLKRNSEIDNRLTALNDLLVSQQNEFKLLKTVTTKLQTDLAQLQAKHERLHADCGECKGERVPLQTVPLAPFIGSHRGHDYNVATSELFYQR